MTGTRGGRGHSREDVARTALRILDEHGLPDFTMRRLGAALDVQPSALYWHFPDKQSLLAELADRIVAEAVPRSARRTATADEWAERIRDEAAALRRALLAHRDGAEVVASTTALGLGSTAAHDALAAAVREGGFDERTVRRAASALLHFVLGHVSHEQQRMQLARLGVLAADAAHPSGARETAAEFAFGVDLLVRGLERSR